MIKQGKYDPLDYIRRASRAPLTAAKKIAEAAIPAGTLNESHWAEGAQQRLSSTMMFVAFDPLFQQTRLPRTMESVWLLLSDPEIERQSLKLMMLSDDKFVADQASAFLKAGKDNREMQGIRNQIRVSCGTTFNEPAILKMFTGTNVDFSEMGKRPMTVYVALPGDMAVTHSKVMTILVTIALSEIERGGLRSYGE